MKTDRLEKIKLGAKIKLQKIGMSAIGMTREAKANDFRVGKIVEKRKYYLVIQFEHYKECITLADLIAPINYMAYVRKAGEWVRA